ncbi:MAG: hypothetical protein L0Y55_15610, partial [Anaerolineales bacterium]|nr:hypothetical protein [Anaerolineales bacterium]
MANSSNVKTNDCPRCHGVGFFRRDVPVDHPDFGRAFPCECKIRETQQSDLADLRQTSGLTHLPQMTFAAFRSEGIGLPPDKRKNLRDAYDATRAFAENPRGWVLLKGGYGCGKTHL